MSENYRPLVLEKIEEFSRSIPDYSFCEMMFSFISQYERSTGKKFVREDLLGEITDQVIYRHISTALEKEVNACEKPVRSLSRPKYNLQDNVDILYSSGLEYWNTTLELIEGVQNSFDKESKTKLKFIITKQQTNEQG